MRSGARAIAFLLLLAVFAGAGVFLYFSQREKPAPPEVEVQEKVPIHEVIGRSVEGRTLDAYRFGAGETELLFVGGIHGGYEWNSVLLAYEAMDYLKSHPELIPKEVTVTIIPVLNPDGLFKVVGREGRFTVNDVPNIADTSPGRFNAHTVDLNRNFDCKWEPTSMWRGASVSGGSAAFSEPESRALKFYVEKYTPDAVIFWHSQSNAVYGSECEDGILPETEMLMNTYAKAAGYPAVASFTQYKITGDAEGWLASKGIPAITVELSTHEDVEWDKNKLGLQALIDLYKKP